MNKVLSIIGTTAVGKTAYALHLAHHLLKNANSMQGIDLISADSRQVYEGIEMISGVDLDENWSSKNTKKGQKYWQHNTSNIRIFGVSFLKPTEDWSVSHFQRLAQGVIHDAHLENSLPIIVGGTGLYVTHLANSELVGQPPPSMEIREKAEILSVLELQDWLKKLDSEKLASLNVSDAHNPRRLVRAIEIASQSLTSKVSQEHFDFQTKTIGLQTDFEIIEAKIKARVAARLANGAMREVEELIARYPNQKLPIFSATGVRPLMALVAEQVNQEECLELWFRQERQYAKRQLTWWKKRTEITWFDVSNKGWQTEATSLIDAWLSATVAIY